MSDPIKNIYNRLYRYAEHENFSGWDPFDGLESRVFQGTPLRDLRTARLGWLQLVKRSPVNLRPLLLVPKGVNTKTLALFALAELSRYRATGDEHHATNARALTKRLLDMGICDQNTLSFGYNFDWQSRAFFARRGTPAIVPTAFACKALLEAHDAFSDQCYLSSAKEIGEFVVNKLHRREEDDGICFSYTPHDATRVFNASLLAAECLASVGASEKNDEYLSLAERAVKYVIQHQRSDGAWTYGEGAHQEWVDNFHTAYVLLSLKRIAADVPDVSKAANASLERGSVYWQENFFLYDGTPKYYDHSTYPVDIHSAAVAIGAAAELGNIDLANRVSGWTCRNMLDPDGFFYYRIGRVIANETPFMRWGQAWMAYALARLIEAR